MGVYLQLNVVGGKTGRYLGAEYMTAQGLWAAQSRVHVGHVGHVGQKQDCYALELYAPKCPPFR